MKVNKAIKQNEQKEKDGEASELLKKEMIKIFNEEAKIISPKKQISLKSKPEVSESIENSLDKVGAGGDMLASNGSGQLISDAQHDDKLSDNSKK